MAAPPLLPAWLRLPLQDARARLAALYGDRLRRVILYGSHARGEAHEESDVDVLVVLESPVENSYQEIKRTSEIQAVLLDRYELLFSFQHYAEADVQARQGPFMQNVREEGIEL